LVFSFNRFGFSIFWAQNLKNQIMTTNLWVEQVNQNYSHSFALMDVKPRVVLINRLFWHITVLVRLQVAVESGGLRRRRHAQHPLGEHLASGYRPLQQVSGPISIE
jgi:hypothetical protein